jgi:hypothetical protein
MPLPLKRSTEQYLRISLSCQQDRQSTSAGIMLRPASCVRPEHRGGSSRDHVLRDRPGLWDWFTILPHASQVEPDGLAHDPAPSPPECRPRLCSPADLERTRCSRCRSVQREPRTSFQPRLPQETALRLWAQVLRRMASDRDAALLFRMLLLPVTAFDHDQSPAVIFNYACDIPDLHSGSFQHCPDGPPAASRSGLRTKV